MNTPESIATSPSPATLRPVLLLLGIAAVFMVTGAITLHLASASGALAPPVSPQRLIAVVLGWSIAWGGALFYLVRCRPQADLWMLPPAALLTGWGLLLQARLAPNFLRRQIVWLILGVALMCALSSSTSLMRLLRRYRYTLLVGGLLLLATTLLFGVNPSGAGERLWLGAFGLYFQPSELLKLLLIVYLAAYLADRREIPRRSVRRGALWPAVLGPMLLMIGLALVLLAWQEDLGAALLFYLTALAMLYLAWGRLEHVLIGGLMFVPVVAAGALLSTRVALRVSIWLDPWAPEQADRAFQILQSLFAIAAGGLFGQGLGLGRPDLIPVVHSDFVYAALVNEFGVTGAVAVLGLLAWLIQRALKLARRSEAPFEALLAGGIAAWIGIQSSVIIAGNLKLIPLTGVTLPFLSYGGSSLVMLLGALGLLLNISTPHPVAASLPLKSAPNVPPLAHTLLGLGKGLLLLLSICALETGYWAVARADALRAYPTNPHRILAEMRIQRGRILDRRGVALADITIDQRGYVERLYPVPAAAPVVGYATLEYGTDGMEAACDPALRGDLGRTAWVAAREQLLQQAPQGADIRLTLDARLQQQAQALLAQQQGAIVLMDSHSGEILALASAPTYDPATVAENWDSLREDPTSPLLNRVTQAPVQPGGALQTLITAAALERGLSTATFTPTFAAPIMWNGHTLTCRMAPGGDTWEAALSSACPAPFAAAGQMLGAESLAEVFARWGLTTAPALELPVLVAEWDAENVTPLMEALGQGELLVTPLQMAGVVAALANDGVRPPLHLLEKSQPGCPEPPAAATRLLDATLAVRLRTAWPSWTGDAVGHLSTALAGPGRTLSWFLGINSAKLPRFAVVVLLENAADPEIAADIGAQLLHAAVAPPAAAP